jgi:hypothetical protein
LCHRYHQNCDCPDTFVTPGGEEACATSTTSSTTQPPVVDLWEMPPRRLETRVPNAFKTSFEGSEVMSAERFSTPNPNFDQDQYSSWLELKYYSRHLQTAADPVYSTSDWGPCQCETTEEHIWGVCGTGFQERTVDCTSSSGCPLSRQPCDCTHCANCQADIFILISAILFLLQAGCAGLVVLGYYFLPFYFLFLNVKLITCIIPMRRSKFGDFVPEGVHNSRQNG